jgi:anti-sigma B factor antagonist
MPDAPQFAVDVERLEGAVAVVVLVGEVDLYTAPKFKDVVMHSIDDGARGVVVDLTGATFIDSTALGVLVSAGKRLRPQRGALAIACLDGNIRRILEITGLGGVFAICPNRAAALEALALKR